MDFGNVAPKVSLHIVVLGLFCHSVGSLLHVGAKFCNQVVKSCRNPSQNSGQCLCDISNPAIPADTCLRWVTSPPHQVRRLLLPSSSSPEPCGTNTQDCYFWRMPEHDAAIQLNLAPSRRGSEAPKQQYNIWLLTSTQISKKRQTQALLQILQSGTLPVVVFIKHIFICDVIM